MPMPRGKRPKVVREKISRTMKSKRICNRTGKPKYPWDRWFAKNRVRIVLTRGVDFKCSMLTMRQMVCNRASERGISVQNEIEGKRLVVNVVKR